MPEHARGPFAVGVARVGRTNLGAGTVVIDDETLTVMVPSTDPKSIRVRLAHIATAVAAHGELEITLRDGRLLTVRGDRLAELRAAVLESCRVLPELTRALRSFGSRRRHRSVRSSSADEQHKFFAPLLLARRAATSAAGPEAAIAAFDADALSRAFEAALLKFAADRFSENPPARRALEAELVDLAEPLRHALTALAAAAAGAVAAVDDLSQWRVWAACLSATFESADRIWPALDETLERAAGRPR